VPLAQHTAESLGLSGRILHAILAAATTH
jgi:hypothetical protein